MSRIALIGDIHGCLYEFQDLIAKVNPGKDDRVICLGDFMDKGPYPAECVRFARESGFESVLGNHEERHIRWRKHEDARKHEEARRGAAKKNPMRPMDPEDEAANEALSPEDWAWLKSLPTRIDLGANWVAVHGGFLPDQPYADQHPNEVIRVRWVRRGDDGKWMAAPTDYTSADTIMKPPEGGRHWADVWEGPQNVVYGHEAFSLTRPKVTTFNGVQTWGIDTGAAHGGHLTALILPTLELVQVKSRAHYADLLVPIPP